jgi:hypothetical protein
MLIENAGGSTEFVRAYDVLMVRWFAVFICAAVTLPCQAQDGSELAAILNFEAPHAQSCPAGWLCDPSESISTDSAVVHGGNWSVRIERQASTPKKFSGITKSIPIDFSGTTIELHGFIRTENVQEFCAFWMREDGISGNVAFVSMQGTQPARGTKPWTEYKISLPVKPEARELFFGFLLGGPGKAWADDLQLLVDKKPVWAAPKVERPKTALDTDHEFDNGSRITLDGLTKTQIENLTPDEEVKPTIAGIRDGRDEVLEAAIRHVLGQALHDDAEAKQVQRRREGRSDYTIRHDSYQSRKVSGHPALSYIADFTEDGHAKTEYFTFVRTDKLIIFLFGNVPTADLDAFHKSFDRMMDTISIP